MLSRLAGSFRIRPGTAIVLPPQPDDRLRACAADLRRHLGLPLPVEAHGRRRDLGPHIALVLDRRVGARLSSALACQAYRLRVTPDGVEARAADPRGLRHACETLRQLVDVRGRIKACVVRDHPDLEIRGLLVDVSRGKVPRFDELVALVDLCAQLKLNTLMLYTEHTFRFRRHPAIGEHDSPLDAGQMLQLDAHAHERGVDLVPTLQSLGHMEHVLGLPQYRHLAETDACWTLAPGRAGTYRLLSDLYAEYLPNFRSRWFNANCDEPWDLGQGRSRRLARQLGLGGLFVQHVQRVQELARDHGKRTMIWADVIHSEKVRVQELPGDVLLLDWAYEADSDYDRVARLSKHGHEFVVCAGTASWNALFPRVDNSVRNIRGWARAARRHGARGLIITDWGDHGHYNLFGNSLFGIGFGAQQAWSGDVPDAEFDRALSRCLFGEGRGATARWIRKLGALHDPGFAIFNGSPLQLLFFDRLSSAQFLCAASTPQLQRTLSRAESLAQPPNAHNPTLAARELAYAADATRFSLCKAAAGLEYLHWRARPAGLSAVGRRQLARELTQLAVQQRGLSARLSELWLERSQRSNLDAVLSSIARSVRSLDQAARCLQRNRPPRAVRAAPFDNAQVVAEMRKR